MFSDDRGLLYAPQRSRPIEVYIVHLLVGAGSTLYVVKPNKRKGGRGGPTADLNVQLACTLYYLEGRSPEKNVGHVIANSRTIRDLGESSFDSAICIRTVKLKSC